MIGSALEPGLIPRATWYLFERLQALGAKDSSLVPAEDAYTPRAAARDHDSSGEDTASEGSESARSQEEADGGAAAGSSDGHGAGSRRTFKLTASYLQIYNETLVDMLSE